MAELRIDCQTGEATLIEDSQLGIDEMHEGPPEPTTQELAAAKDQRTADLATVGERAAKDPAFAALARLLGLIGR